MQQKKPEEVEEAVVLEAVVVMAEVVVVMEEAVVMGDMEVHQVVVAVEVAGEAAVVEMVVLMEDSGRQEEQPHRSLRNLDTIINYEPLVHCETALNSAYQSLGLNI